MIKVSVIYRKSADSYRKLFEAMSKLLDIEFQFVEEHQKYGNNALVLLDVDHQTLLDAQDSGRPFIAYLTGQLVPVQTTSNVVSFSFSSFLPKILHRKSMVTTEAMNLSEIGIREPFEELAQVQGLAVWAASTRHKWQYYTSVPLPEFGDRKHLSEIFNGETFLRLLPLYCFLKFCICQSNWQPPPLRACFVVDDPNLHWTSYGPINYKRLAKYCRQQEIHVAFATIPLDGWYVHPKAAKIFRENYRYLSLLVHGNNHAKEELAIPMEHDEAINYFAQSLRRIMRLEERSSLSVDRVMAPPHGPICKSSASALARLGFEAVCTNRWSLWKYNHPWDLKSNFGLEPAGFLANRLPVLNRFRMVSEICRNEIIMAALLGMPIIPLLNYVTVF